MMQRRQDAARQEARRTSFQFFRMTERTGARTKLELGHWMSFYWTLLGSLSTWLSVISYRRGMREEISRAPGCGRPGAQELKKGVIPLVGQVGCGGWTNYYWGRLREATN